MKITILRGPALLNETLDAIRIYHHTLSQETYTWPGDICIPAGEITAIVNQACSVLDPTDPALNYYFQPWHLEVDPTCPACLASYMISSLFEVRSSDLDSAVALLKEHFARGTANGFAVSSAGCCALDMESCPANANVPLSQVFGALPVPDGLKRELATVFSAYDKHLDRLVELMRPVAAELERLLMPWVERFDPFLTRWRQDAETIDPQVLLRAEPDGTVDHIQIRMRFIYEHLNQSAIWRADRELHIHLRPMSSLYSLGRLPKDNVMEEHLTGLRLLGDRTRLEILRLTMSKPRYCNELADIIGVNRGIVFRNLNSMYNCDLLSKVVLEGKTCYTINVRAVRALLNYVAEYIALPPAP